MIMIDVKSIIVFNTESKKWSAGQYNLMLSLRILTFFFWCIASATTILTSSIWQIEASVVRRPWNQGCCKRISMLSGIINFCINAFIAKMEHCVADGINNSPQLSLLSAVITHLLQGISDEGEMTPAHTASLICMISGLLQFFTSLPVAATALQAKQFIP